MDSIIIHIHVEINRIFTYLNLLPSLGDGLIGLSGDLPKREFNRSNTIYTYICIPVSAGVRNCLSLLNFYPEIKFLF